MKFFMCASCNIKKKLTVIFKNFQCFFVFFFCAFVDVIDRMASNVQKKISCVFETAVVEEKSSKHAHQSYKVVATERLKERVMQSNLSAAISSEKLDGTCCHVSEYQSKPWLWARLDRKPNKAAEKKFKKHQNSHRAWQCSGKGKEEEPIFIWSQTNFKEVPESWIPASGVTVQDGLAMPDDIGHTPGWVPLEQNSRQYCWHLQAVNLDRGMVLILKNFQEEYNDKRLELCTASLSQYVGRTMELIGTNINGNPYKIGTKEKPIHIYVPHGEVTFQSEPPQSFSELGEWFENTEDGQVEGIVWHCKDGELYKCHRHHLGLRWPVDKPRLLSLAVKINMDISLIKDCCLEDSLFASLGNFNGHTFSSLADININK